MTTPEAAELHALLAVMARAGRRRGRDGGVVARARAGPGRRDCASRSPPSPTSAPTTSTSTGTIDVLLRGQGVALHRGSGRSGGDQRRRRPRARADPAGACSRACSAVRSVSLDGAADYAARRPDRGRAGADRGHRVGPPRTGPVRPRPAGGVQRPQRADRAGHGRPGRRRPRAGGAGTRRCGGAGSDAAHRPRRRRSHACSSTSRTRPRRSAPCWPVWPATVASSCWAVAATATRRSGRRWVPRPRPPPTWWWSPTTTPAVEDPAAIRAQVLAGARAEARRAAAGP